MAKILAFANQKGGVAKTTTTLNLGVAFQELGHRVLAVDMDPQGNLTMSLGLNPDSVRPSMFDVLVNQVSIEDALFQRELDVVDGALRLCEHADEPGGYLLHAPALPAVAPPAQTWR